MKFYEGKKEIRSRDSEIPPTDFWVSVTSLFSGVMNLILPTLQAARLSHIETRATEIQGFRPDGWRIA